MRNKTGVVLVTMVSFLLGGMISYRALAEKKPSETVVIYGSKGGWIHKHAAEEFAKYVNLMTGERVRVINDEALLPGGEKIVLLGNSTINKMTKKLEDKQLLNLSQLLPSDEEGFVIKSIKSGGKEYLLLAGTRNIGTLYAVYDYLERFCQVGFFRDGDYVPKKEKIPFSNIEVVTQPRFKYRSASFSGAYRAFAKFEPTFWDLGEWKRQFDWMAKRKLNLGGVDLFWTDEFSGIAPELAWPELGKAGEEELLDVLKGANSVAWVWPLEYRTKLTKDLLSYGRSLGIKFTYWSNYDCVPGKFKTLHPEFKYPRSDAYGNLFISMDDPEAREYLKKYLQTLIDLYGTDHIYVYGAYAEAAMAETAEESVRIKTEATHKFNLFFKEVDPEAIWFCSTWDFNYPHWNKESVKKYLTAMSKEIPILLYDADSEMSVPGKYEKHGDFYGINWCFGVMNSFGGDDNLHGNIDNIIQKVKAVSQAPKTKNCVGLLMTEELINDNIFLWHLVSKLAWDPAVVDKEEFLRDYALRRYGEGSAPNMHKSLSRLVEAVYTIPPGNYDNIATVYSPERPERYDTPNCPYYQFQRMEVNCEQSFPLFKEREGFIPIELRHLERTLPPLKQAIKLALLEKENQVQNKLYENDLVDMARVYLGLVNNSQLIALYQAFKEGDYGGFEKKARDVERTLDAIEKILSTREDFSLEVMMGQIEKVPGTNRYTRETIKQTVLFWDYVNRDCFEIMHYYYRPKLGAYVSTLREYLKKGVREISKSDVEPSFKQILAGWKQGPIVVEKKFKYKGTTIEAIEEALRAEEGAR